MQANNSPEWKDDAAFWDDAWKDMQQRLDEEPPKRRPVLWWWLGLSAFLLVFVAAAFWFLPPFGNEQSTPATEPIQLREASATKAPIAASENELPTTATTENVSSPGTDQRVKNLPQKVTTSPDRINNQMPSTANARTKTKSAVANAALNDRQTEKAGLHSPALAETTPSPEAPQQVEANKIQEQENTSLSQVQRLRTEFPITGRTTPAAIAHIPNKGIKPLQTRLSLPEVAPIGQRFNGRFELLAGGSLSTAIEKPGYFAGVSYTPPSRGKISFPVSLRYRFDALEITKLDENLLSPPTTEMSTDFDAIQAAEELLSDLAIGNFNELRSAGLELRAGMAWRPAPRLRLSGHGGLEYLFSARGPSISSQDNSFADLSGTGRYVNLEVGGLFFSNSDLVSTPVPGRGGGESSPAGVNRWIVRAGLNADYQLTSRLGVFAGGQFLLSPIYQQQVAQLRKGQLEVGLSWRIR